jgi:hypothetical protein
MLDFSTVILLKYVALEFHGRIRQVGQFPQSSHEEGWTQHISVGLNEGKGRKIFYYIQGTHL